MQSIQVKYISEQQRVPVKRKLNKQELKKLLECRGYHNHITEVFECDSCNLLLGY